jgi:D-alanine-D-alanine ligase
LRIGIAFDLAPTDPALRQEGPDDRFEEFDKPETVEAIAEVIRGEGHEVILFGDGREFLTRVLADPPDFVFNIAEGEGVGRCREARVPAVLEMLGIPYSGSDPLTLSVCLDKMATKQMLQPNESLVAAELGSRLPMGWELPPSPSEVEEELDWLYAYSGRGPLHDRTFWLSEPMPLILKPTFEGSSKGIRGDCIARSKEEAVAIYRRLVQDYQQPILAEEFIEGDEVTVGIVGTNRNRGGKGQEVLGVMRVVPRIPSESFVYSLEVKRDWRNLVDYEVPALYPADLIEMLGQSAMTAAGFLGCRDLARIDFRVRDGVPYFIEANPLPGLAPGTSDLVILARGYGIEYPDLIRKILHAALTRVGLK